MRRITLTAVAILLAVPSAAVAKVGIEFQQDPATVVPGTAMPINIMILREPKDPMAGDMTPIVGARPLVTFRSTSGQTVRVRGGRSDSSGISRGRVTLPDAGPWTSSLRVPGQRLGEGGGNTGTFRVGSATPGSDAAVREVVRPPAETGVASSDSSGPGITWILLGLAAGLGALGFTFIRAGVPARIRARSGGGA